MSIRAPERGPELEPQVEEQGLPGAPDAPPEPLLPPEHEEPLSVPVCALAALLSGTAAAWMAGGLFRGGVPWLYPLAGVLVAIALVALSYRSRHPSFLQYLVLPMAGVTGAILALIGDKAEVGELPDLIRQAVKAGGLGQPPVPLDSGWKFILVIVGALLAAASLSLAMGHGKAQLVAFFPVPLIFAVGMVLPEDKAVVASAVALVLFVASLLVAYGAELRREGATTTKFEVRRLLRGSGVLIVLVAILLGLSQLGFLFPESRNEDKAPPRRPDVQALLSDRILFTVESDQPGPWRLGTLDVYRNGHWLLPPVDSAKLEEIPGSGRIPDSATKGPAATAKFTVDRLEGHILMTPSNARRVTHSGFAAAFDPRTQTLRLPERAARKGMTYTVTWEAPPKAEDLAKAPKAPKALDEFLEAPIQPNEVVLLLAGAPANPWERLGHVRNALYTKVVASGAGKPTKVTGPRVAEMLAGKEANPYEITSADVLLARWAGIPARIGYGFFAGDKKGADGNIFEVHPRHGATFLEAYFEGYGWVPITGVPLKAKGSLSQGQKQANPNVETSDELALVVYVPIRLQSILLLYQIVRYYVAIVLPPLIGLILLWAFFPGFLKAARGRLRRRWARKRGPFERTIVAYSEFRDASNDLNVGDSHPTPLEFVDLIADDAEHKDLAWLVTRGLWGDLRRDLQPEDAEAAELQARSVTRRLRKAQFPITRMLAFASRASLRDPYTYDIPNLWRRRRHKARGRHHKLKSQTLRRRVLRRLRRLLPIGAALTLVVLVVACGRSEQTSSSSKAAQLPNRVAPGTLGDYQMQREPEVEKQFGKAGNRSLVREGQVFTIRKGPDVEGYLQVASFRSGINAGRKEVRDGILEGIGGSRFQPDRVGVNKIFTAKSLGQRYFIWFPDHGRYFELLVAKDSFQDAGQIFAGILAHQRGEKGSDAFRQVPEYRDFRRGGDD